MMRFWQRLTNGCWRHHGETSWEAGKLRCQRCWLVVWDTRKLG